MNGTASGINLLLSNGQQDQYAADHQAVIKRAPKAADRERCAALLFPGLRTLLECCTPCRTLVIPFGSRNTSEDAKLFFGQAIQKTVA